MEKLVVIQTLKELKELKTYLRGKTYVAFDTETNGVEKESKIIGFSVCADVNVGYYVILSYWNTEQQKLVDLETLEGTKDLLQDLVPKSLIMQNAPFDCWMVENNFQIKLMDSVHTDTMILGHILDENRSNGLKELGVALFGEDARKEQEEMKASVAANGGVLTKDKYELYKADSMLMARYGAKDAILTFKVFHTLVPQLFDEGLNDFFYEDESMPLLRGPTYELNTTGLRVDPEKLQTLKNSLESECMQDKAYIYSEVLSYVKHKYPGTGKTNIFNIGAAQQRSWLLFEVLGEEFHTLTEEGRAVCRALGMNLPYGASRKREFIDCVKENKGRVYSDGTYNHKTKKMGKPKVVKEPWIYMACGKETLQKYSGKYRWLARYLSYAKNLKILNTYVEGIQEKMQYNVIRPSFLQHGTTSGRYSSRRPNFQNLPRDDKRVKSCIVSRPGKVFVGADYSQLEPRVFASFSKDERLLNCFKDGDDFYSVIGVEVFEKHGCSLKKDDEDSFAKLHPNLRNISKVVALSSTYGTTAFKMAPAIGKNTQEAEDIINSYFDKFPSVYALMLESHELAKDNGAVHNLFGRPRRIPVAKDIKKLFGNTAHSELEYSYRNVLNLAINHRIQSTGASIMNRAAIAVWKTCRRLGLTDVKLVMQVHDELILECPEAVAKQVVNILKYCMENTTKLPGVDLIAEPKIAKNLADLK